jgi:hypothetical protein
MRFMKPRCSKSFILGKEPALMSSIQSQADLNDSEEMDCAGVQGQSARFWERATG